MCQASKERCNAKSPKRVRVDSLEALSVRNIIREQIFEPWSQYVADPYHTHGFKLGIFGSYTYAEQDMVVSDADLLMVVDQPNTPDVFTSINYLPFLNLSASEASIVKRCLANREPSQVSFADTKRKIGGIDANVRWIGAEALQRAVGANAPFLEYQKWIPSYLYRPSDTPQTKAKLLDGSTKFTDVEIEHIDAGEILKYMSGYYQKSKTLIVPRLWSAVLSYTPITECDRLDETIIQTLSAAKNLINEFHHAAESEKPNLLRRLLVGEERFSEEFVQQRLNI